MSLISDYDYDLPKELIAQTPAEPRDHARLMVVSRDTPSSSPLVRGRDSQIEHKKFYEIANELREGDVLVLNKTKVFKARLRAGGAEVFLLRVSPERVTPPSLPLKRGGSERRWQALVKPGRKIKIGQELDIDGMIGIVRSKQDDGTVTIEFDRDAAGVITFADQHGEIPLPPYIETKIDQIDDYQTVYAKDVGSVAAPTAGLHFTPELLKTLEAKGVQIEYITLHVGLGTFQPVRSETLEEHQMHAEFVEIDAGTAQRINEAKSQGRKVIAVGTTTTRALEGAVVSPPYQGGVRGGLLPPGFAGDVNIFIKPGFQFKIVDGLITNFHLPKTTLLVLVSTFGGHELMKRAYAEAMKQTYRFFSFGDAMFIR